MIVSIIASIAGMLLTTPLGILVDVVKSKRAIIVFAALAVVIACGINYFYTSFVSTTLTDIAGASIPPAISSITMDIVGANQFDHQLGQNESYNYAGNAFSAIIQE